MPSWFDGGSHHGLVWLEPIGIGICRELHWFMEQHGFELVAAEDFETRLGRHAIGTFAYRRVL